MVNSIFKLILIVISLFIRLPTDDPRAHIAKLNYVCKSCIGRQDWVMNVIGVRVFPLSLTGDSSIWINEIPYNSIYTWDKLTKAFLERIFLVLRNNIKNYMLNNFVVQPGECVSNSWN